MTPSTTRTTATGEDDVVVFLIGMRFTSWRRVRDWWPVFTAMPRMLAELGRSPELGLLGARTYWSGRVLMVVQYWRSFEALEAYARAADREHLPAWSAFSRAARSGSGVGIFHETYVVPAGSRESVYAGMPDFGLGLALGTRPVGAATARAAQRLTAVS